MKRKRKWGQALWKQSPGAVARMLETKPTKVLKARRREPIRKVSGAMAKKLRGYAKLRKQFLTDRYVCERCRARAASQIHHKRGRAGTLLTDWRHWMPVCPVCHAWIGDNPALARAEGWLAPMGRWNQPSATPCPEYRADFGANDET